MAQQEAHAGGCGVWQWLLLLLLLQEMLLQVSMLWALEAWGVWLWLRELQSILLCVSLLVLQLMCRGKGTGGRLVLRGGRAFHDSGRP